METHDLPSQDQGARRPNTPGLTLTRVGSTSDSLVLYKYLIMICIGSNYQLVICNSRLKHGCLLLSHPLQFILHLLASFLIPTDASFISTLPIVLFTDGLSTLLS